MKTKDISLKQKLEEYFLDHPSEKLRVRQIERVVKLPLPSAIRYAKELEKENILKISTIAGIKVYSAERASKAFLIEKRLYNIKKLSSSGLIEYLIDVYSNPAIVLFGSYSKGEDIEKSDIDIYVESPSKKDIDLKKFDKILGRKIQLFVYDNIKKVPNPMLANNILNGIILNGFVEVFK